MDMEYPCKPSKFHNKHKALYNLFSPDPAVCCVCGKLVSILKCTNYVVVCCISFMGLSFLLLPLMRLQGTNDFY